MNKLNKLGITALCGSLAAISSANAGDLSVTGGVDMTWMSLDAQQSTGNPIGVGSNYTLKGSGELENGWSVDLSIAMTNANAYSNTTVTVGLPGLGDVLISQGVSGTGIQRMDDLTPSVWEEADGAGLSAGITKVAGTSAGSTIEVTPTDMMPAGLTARFAWSPDSDGKQASDKGTSGGTSGDLGAGWDLTLEAGSDLHGVDGLTVYGGMSQVDRFQNASTVSGDSDERVLGIKYAMGNFTAGYQINNDDTGGATNGEYDNTMYSITFNVNDDLSIGYGHVESEKENSNTAEADSIQIAYTMGGASFRLAEVDVENKAYSTAATSDLENTIISVGLAF
jgi:outer membrane protein OmpU